MPGSFTTMLDLLNAVAELGDDGWFLKMTPITGSLGTVTTSPYAIDCVDFSTSATSVSTEVIPANLTRKFLLIQNTSLDNVWINFGDPATLSSPSIMLSPNQTYLMESGVVFSDSLNIITDGTSSSVTIKEG